MTTSTKQVVDSAQVLVPDGLLSRPMGSALGVAAIGLGVSAIIGIGQPAQLWRAYLVAYLFLLSLALGGLFFVLLHFATSAGWSVVVRRIAEHVMGTLPVLALLFLPLIFGLRALYPWSNPDIVAGDALLQHKQLYLNTGFFYLRAAFYLVTWSVLAWWFRAWSLRQDDSGEEAITLKLQRASAPALVVFGLTVTFAAFDWIMSLDPHWSSTIFGVYFFAGCVVAGLALLLILILWLQGRGLLTDMITLEHHHDLGKLLFAFVCFWAYIGFSQFLLIWYANEPEETEWYARRLHGGWSNLTIALAIGHFVLPFLFLLPRTLKRKRPLLLAAPYWLLVMHYLDLYWLVVPSLTRTRPGLHPLDLTVLGGLGGLFVAVLSFLMRQPGLVPLRDPRLEESLRFKNQ
ncbi:MAG: quinol:cytochrome C oxidoreductase [Acidobacteriota bacterium]